MHHELEPELVSGRMLGASAAGMGKWGEWDGNDDRELDGGDQAPFETHGRREVVVCGIGGDTGE